MDDDRIIRIARALCRSARLDPDKPVEDSASLPMQRQSEPVSASSAAWMHFRKSAEEFVARHSERVVAPL